MLPLHRTIGTLLTPGVVISSRNNASQSITPRCVTHYVPIIRGSEERSEIRARVRSGSSVGDSALIIAVTKASPPITFVIAPFPESVGGRGRMEGGHKGKEEGKGRREKRRVDDESPGPICASTPTLSPSEGAVNTQRGSEAASAFSQQSEGGMPNNAVQ
ncbi:hypothetical protein KUCAC02_019988, partial [Chaenocephalus aceratus]